MFGGLLCGYTLKRNSESYLLAMSLSHSHSFSVNIPLSLNRFIADTMVCTGCCATLDNIVTYLFKRLTNKSKKTHPTHQGDSEAFLRILELHPEILQQVIGDLPVLVS